MAQLAVLDYDKHIASIVLDSIAPAIINRSKVEALREMADDLEQFEAFPGEEPQRLRARADEIEAGR